MPTTKLGTVSPQWGRDFRFQRMRRMLTQSQVAHFAGVSQAFVSRVESGKDLKVSELERLYRALGCAVRGSVI